MAQGSIVTILESGEATVTLKTRQETVVDSNARISQTVRKPIPAVAPPETVAYAYIAIEATETGARIAYTSDAPVSTQWKWREADGMWQIFLGAFFPLKTSHYAAITHAFEVGTVYEFQALGFDIDGNNQEGAVVEFQLYETAPLYRFTTA